MADITMCEEISCPKKFECYRYTAMASEWRQSYFADSPWDDVKKECLHFWNNGKKNEQT
jgi:hypothetical protein